MLLVYHKVPRVRSLGNEKSWRAVLMKDTCRIPKQATLILQTPMLSPEGHHFA
jgi:hypothetical protein